jgi:hypothetical protein
VPEIVAALRARTKALPAVASVLSALSEDIRNTVEIAGDNGHPPHSDHMRSEVPK